MAEEAVADATLLSASHIGSPTAFSTAIKLARDLPISSVELESSIQEEGSRTSFG